MISAIAYRGMTTMVPAMTRVAAGYLYLRKESQAFDQFCSGSPRLLERWRLLGRVPKSG